MGKGKQRDWMLPQRLISLMLPLMRCIQTQLSYAQQQTRSFSGSVVTSSFFCSSWEKLYCRDQTVTGSALSATTSLLLFCRWFVHRKQVSRCMYINLPVGGTKRCIFTHFYVFYVLRKHFIRAQDHFMFLSIFSPKVKSTMTVLKWFLQQFVHLLSVNKAQIVWAVIFSLTFNNASVSSNIIFDYCSFLLKQLHNEWIIVRWRNVCLLQHVPQLSFTGCKIIVQSTHVCASYIFYFVIHHPQSLFIHIRISECFVIFFIYYYILNENVGCSSLESSTGWCSFTRFSSNRGRVTSALCLNLNTVLRVQVTRLSNISWALYWHWTWKPWF